jgi:hypothetical protein
MGSVGEALRFGRLWLEAGTLGPEYPTRLKTPSFQDES